MSKLDNLYTFYRRYCKEIGNHRRGAIITQLIIQEDGSGKVETKIYLPDDSNPFRVHTEEVVRFDNPADGAAKLQEIVDGKKDLSSSGKAGEGKLDENPAQSSDIS